MAIDYFGKRAVAYILDFFVVSAFMWIISYALFLCVNYYNIFEIYHYFIFVLPAIQIIYFTVLEKVNHATIGKRLMYIEVDAVNGRLNYRQTFVRNISKIFWIIIVLDLIIGLIAGKGDRFLSYITRTYVRLEIE